MGNGNFDDFDLNSNGFSSDDDFGFGSDDAFGDTGGSFEGDSFGGNSSGDLNNVGQSQSNNESDDLFPDSGDLFDNTSNSNSNDSEFNDLFNNNNAQNTDEQENGLKKNSLVIIIVGVILVIAVIFIASKVIKHNDSGEQANAQNEQTDIDTETYDNDEYSNEDEYYDDTNSDDVNNDYESDDDVNDNAQNNQTIYENSYDEGLKWVEVSNSENIEFKKELVSAKFTVTNIKHLARAVDTNNNLVIETRILGGISGLSGTYELYVPYDRGSKLNIGDVFDIKYQLGSYNGKTVVGDIQY